MKKFTNITMFLGLILSLAAVDTMYLGQNRTNIKAQINPNFVINEKENGKAEVPGWLASNTANTVAHSLFGDVDNHGAVKINENQSLFLYGDRVDVEALLKGEDPNNNVRGIITSGYLEKKPIIGVLNFTSQFVIQTLRNDKEYLKTNLVVEYKNGPNSWLEAEKSFIDSFKQITGYAIEPQVTCNSTCGSSNGLSFAGETPYSNGVNTADPQGNSCAGVGTYGYLYQCVEYVKRVHKRSDWRGNAYEGYFSSTSSGPYQKGLIPFGTGTSYAPLISGDIVVFSGGEFGHVGVALEPDNSNNTVTLYDQNRSCNSQSCELSYTTNDEVYTLGNGDCLGASYSPVAYLRRGWDFNSTQGLGGTGNWQVVNSTYVGGTNSGSVTDLDDHITIDPKLDPQLISPAGMSLPTYSTTTDWGYNQLFIRLQSNCANKTAKVYWTRTTDSSFNEARSVTANIDGNDWTTLVFNFKGNSNWNGTISQIRVDLAENGSLISSDNVSVAYLYFSRDTTIDMPQIFLPNEVRTLPTVPVGQSSTATLEVRNSSTSVPLTITSIINNGNPSFSVFSPTAFPVIVPANTSISLGLKFSPTVAGPQSTAFTISNDSNTPNKTFSTEGFATVPPQIPAPPSSLQGIVLSRDTIRLSWQDNSPDETNFEIYRRLGTTSIFTYLGKVPANTKTFDHVGAFLPGKTYVYKVRAINSAGASAYSNEVAVTIPK